MIWIAPSEKDAASATLEERLCIQLFHSALNEEDPVEF